MTHSALSRRTFLKLSGLTLGAAALAACTPPGGAPASSGSTSSEAAPATTPQSLWVLLTSDFHPDYNAFIKKHVEDWAAEKGFTIEIGDMAGFVAGGSEILKIAAGVAAGDSADVMQRNASVPLYHQLGTLMPVTALVEANISQYGNVPVRQQKDLKIEGEWYAVPFHVRSDGGWVRKDIWEAAGIDPFSTRSYDEFRDMCLEVSNPEKEIWGWGMTVNRGGDGSYLVGRVLNGWGANWVDETGQFVTIDTPEAVAAVEWLVDTYTNPKWERMLPPGVLSWTDPTNNEAYLGGKLAFTQNGGTVYAKAVVDKNPVAETTVWDKPKGGPALQEFFGMSSMNFHQIVGGKNPEGAQALISSFFTDDVLKKVYTVSTTYSLPAYEKMWDWEEITSVPNSIAHKEGAFDPAGWNGLAYPGPATPQIAAVDSQNLQTDMIAAVLNKQATAAEAVKQASEKSIAIFKEKGAPGSK